MGFLFENVLDVMKMINIFKTTQYGLKEIIDFEQDIWINVSKPNQEELQKLVEKLKIPSDFLTDPLDPNETSRVEVENNFTLIVLRIPRFDGGSIDNPFTTLPVGIILTKDSIITVCSEHVELITDFINGKVKNFSVKDRARFILQMFTRTALGYLKYLKEIQKTISIVQREIHKTMRNEELIKLMNMENSLVYFTTSLRSNELMIERLQKMKTFIGTFDEDLLEDVIVDNKQAIEMANVYSNILSGMMDSFASIISNNLNTVMKFLTSVTIILMLPTLIASIYGMNVELPFQNSSHAFFLTIGISLVLSIIGIIIFINKKWF